MLEINSTLSVLDCEAARWPPFLSSAHLDHTPSSYLFAFTPLWLATRTISLINQYCTYLHTPIFQDHVPVTLVIKGKMGNDSFFISTEMLRAYNEGGISLKQGQASELLKFCCRSVTVYSKFGSSVYEARVTDLRVSRWICFLKFGAWQEL